MMGGGVPAWKTALGVCVLVDGALAECDRVGDGRTYHSGKHRNHGVNHQVVTGLTGKLVRISRALPGAPTT